MPNFEDKIAQLSSQSTQELDQATSPETVDQIRTRYLGKKGLVTALFAEFKTASLEEKKVIGPKLNTLKISLSSAIEDKVALLHKERLIAQNRKATNFDVTAYRQEQPFGHKHPYSHVIEEIEDIFISMGYAIGSGPEVETDVNNFTALNIPSDHPARDMYDTFWLNSPDQLLRTHTTTVQARAMQNATPPLAVFSPGRCFRHEATDASHDFMFFQGEGFLVDKGITLSHLFGTAQTFLQLFFGKKEIPIRTRPGFFPFVEPGVEIDMRCPFCRSGCSVCKKSTWIEIFPGGLIHPNVLRAGNIDPKIYSGFAFGFGLTRLVMIKYQINDIRLLHGGSMQFLEQF